jgi:bifunctional DNA-binding transcriptional regulator/antitoxin component of YhaV-PrlF toxin-antitoxin module
MLAKMTSKNQITIPKAVLAHVEGVQHFDVQYRDGMIVMKPVKVYDTDLEEIRRKERDLGLSEDSVQEAIAWARSRP